MNSKTQQPDNFPQEYDELEQDRRASHNVITSRDQLLLPLAVAVFAFLGSQMPEFVQLGVERFALTVGGLLLAILLGTWRAINLYTDYHIVRMYHHEVELEQKLGLKKRTRYIYGNLSRRSRKLLAKDIGTEPKLLKMWTYEEFVHHVSKLEGPKCPYQCLIRVLKEYGYRSVSSRGHFIWNSAAGALLLLWLIMALFWVFCWQPTDP